LQLVVDNVPRKPARAKPWRARNPRSPASTWLNRVERGLALINQQIELFVQRYNADATPFQDGSLRPTQSCRRVERIAKRVSATAH
jgi:hypothetical protein